MDSKENSNDKKELEARLSNWERPPRSYHFFFRSYNALEGVLLCTYTKDSNNVCKTATLNRDLMMLKRRFCRKLFQTWFEILCTKLFTW